MSIQSELPTQKTDLPTSIEAINRQRRSFQNWKTTALSSYLEYKKSNVEEDRLIVFNGIEKGLQWNLLGNCQLLPHLLVDESIIHTRNGGYWASLQGSSFVINPGKSFLERFSNHGRHLWDINNVIITDSSQASSFDLMRIYSLNKEVNALLRQWNLPPHVIRYFLHRDAYTKFSHLLQPTCREERSFVEMLTTFGDNHSCESLRFGENLVMEYATSCPSGSSIMLRFCTSQQAPTLGFVAQTYQQKHSAFLESCQTLLIGAGKIDLQGLTQEGLLGLLKGVQSPLTLLSEIDFSEGDMRIEALKALREELVPSKMTLLPCEVGVTVNLSTQTMLAPGLANPTLVTHVKTARSQGTFSPLQYLESSFVL